MANLFPNNDLDSFSNRIVLVRRSVNFCYILDLCRLLLSSSMTVGIPYQTLITSELEHITALLLQNFKLWQSRFECTSSLAKLRLFIIAHSMDGIFSEFST